MRERKQGKNELGEAVSLFEVRVARQDEGVDAERDVFLHPRRHGLGIANQRRAGAATHQSDAGPQVGADLELVAAAAVQLGHPALTDRVHAGKNLLCIGDRLVAQVPDQVVGGFPGLGIGLAHDDMQPDSEAHAPAAVLRERGDATYLLRNLRRRFTPGQVLVDALCGRCYRGV